MVHAILPRWAVDGGRNRHQASKLLDVHHLLPYIQQHQLHLAPAGVDDDVFILSFALETANASILTNDLYRDHAATGKVTRGWLDEHLMAFMFVPDQDDTGSGADGHRLLVPSSTLGQRSPSPASVPMTTGLLDVAGQNRLSSPSAESSSSTQTTVAPGQRIVRRLGYGSIQASSGSTFGSGAVNGSARSPKQSITGVTKQSRNSNGRCRGRQGSGPSMKELLARSMKLERRF